MCNTENINTIASAIADMSESIVDSITETFDGERSSVLEFADGTPVPFCPMTRRYCMGRACAAAKRGNYNKLAAITTGHKAEWRCAEYGNVVDFDAAEQPTPEEADAPDAAQGDSRDRDADLMTAIEREGGSVDATQPVE